MRVELPLFRESCFDNHAFRQDRCRNRNYCIFHRISCYALPEYYTPETPFIAQTDYRASIPQFRKESFEKLVV